MRTETPGNSDIESDTRQVSEGRHHVPAEKEGIGTSSLWDNVVVS